MPQTNNLLALPKEVRDIIIGYAVQNDVVTISATKCATRQFTTVDDIKPGPGWVPIARHGYDPELIQSTMLSQVETEDDDSVFDTYFSTFQILRVTCKQLRDEVQEYMNSARVQNDDQLRDAPLDLYLTFPHGVCAIVEQAPQLLKRVRSIKIASVFSLQQLPEKQFLSSHADPHIPHKANSQTKEQLSALSLLIGFLMSGRDTRASHEFERLASVASFGFAKSAVREPFGMSTASKTESNRILRRNGGVFLQGRLGTLSNRSRLSALRKPLPLEHFQCRILHPTTASPQETHAALWNNPHAPTCKVIKSIPGGTIWVSTARGEQSTMVEIEAVPNPRDPLVVTSRWPSKFVEGMPGLLASRWIEGDQCRSSSCDMKSRGANGGIGWASHAPGTSVITEPRCVC